MEEVVVEVVMAVGGLVICGRRVPGGGLWLGRHGHECLFFFYFFFLGPLCVFE